MIILCIVVICLGITLYNTHVFKYNLEEYANFENNTEGFEDYNYKDAVKEVYNTTLERYKLGADFSKNNGNADHYYNYFDLYDVNAGYPLFTYGCIKNALSDNVFEELSSLFYVSYKEFYSVSVNDIYQKIAVDLNDTIIRTSAQFIDGPIYVLIYQAPYLQFGGEQIIARHDTINNLKGGYMQNRTDVIVGQKQLYTKIFVMYPAYYVQNNKVIKYSDKKIGLSKFSTYFKNKLVRNKLCFMECNAVNNYACGCLNKDPDDKSLYTSSCVELDNKKYNYGVIYALNRFNKLFSKQIRSEQSSTL